MQDLDILKQQKVIQHQETFYRLLGIFSVVFLLGGFVLWAALAPLQASVVAEGKVAVENRNIVLQHFDGGVVKQIYVKEGQVVEKNQPILDLTTSSLDLEMISLKSKYYEAKVKEFLFSAALKQINVIEWPQDFQSLIEDVRWSQYLKSASQLHSANILKYNGELALFDTKFEQSIRQEKALQAKKQILQERIKILQEDIADQDKLYAQKMTDKRRLRQLYIEMNAAESELTSVDLDLTNLKSTVAESKLQKELYKQQTQQMLEESLIAQKSILFSLEPQIHLLENKIKRTQVFAPNAGSILGFSINTIGQIIPPQGKILDIVPNDQSFAFEAKVQPKDIDLVKIGQEVEVKFVTFNIRFEYSIYGTVESIGADVKMDENTRQNYYQVMVKPTPTMLDEIKHNQWKVLSGMPVALFIQTRQQTLAEYLLRPFKEAFMKAFNEDDGLS